MKKHRKEKLQHTRFGVVYKPRNLEQRLSENTFHGNTHLIVCLEMYLTFYTKVGNFYFKISLFDNRLSRKPIKQGRLLLKVEICRNMKRNCRP